MKKKYILPLVTSLLVLGSCDYVEDNFEGIEQFDHPTNVFTKDYTLTAEDYTSIADLKANKDLAEANGVEDQLSALKTSMAFTDELPASDYLPAFLMENWFSGDEGSAIRVTYNKRLPYTDTERAINAATMYTVSADDYMLAWEGVANNFFTPSVSASRFVLLLIWKKKFIRWHLRVSWENSRFMLSSRLDWLRVKICLPSRSS